MVMTDIYDNCFDIDVYVVIIMLAVILGHENCGSRWIFMLSMSTTRISHIYSANKGCGESEYIGENHDDFFVDLFILSLNKLVDWGYDVIHHKKADEKNL